MEDQGNRDEFARFVRAEELAVAAMTAAISHYVSPLRAFLQRFNDPDLRENVLQFVGTEAVFDVLRHFDALELLEKRALSFVDELHTAPRSLPHAFLDHTDLLDLYVKYCSRSERVSAVQADLTATSASYRELIARLASRAPAGLPALTELLAAPARRVFEYLELLSLYTPHGPSDSVDRDAALQVVDSASERIVRRRDREERRLLAAVLARSLGGSCVGELDLTGNPRIVRQAEVGRLRQSGVRATASYILLLLGYRIVLCKAPPGSKQYRVSKTFAVPEVRIRDLPNTPDHSNIVEISAVQLLVNSPVTGTVSQPPVLASTTAPDLQPLLAVGQVSPAILQQSSQELQQQQQQQQQQQMATTRASRQASQSKRAPKTERKGATLRLIMPSHEEKVGWLQDIRDGARGRLPEPLTRRGARETVDFGSSQLASSSAGWANSSLDITLPRGSAQFISLALPAVPDAIALNPGQSSGPDEDDIPTSVSPLQPKKRADRDSTAGSPAGQDTRENSEQTRGRSRSDSKDKDRESVRHVVHSSQPVLAIPPELARKVSSKNPIAAIATKPHAQSAPAPMLLSSLIQPAPPPIQTLPSPPAPTVMAPIPIPAAVTTAVASPPSTPKSTTPAVHARNIRVQVEGDPDLSEVRVTATDSVGDVVRRIESEILEEGQEVDKFYKCTPQGVGGATETVRVLLRKRQYSNSFEEMMGSEPSPLVSLYVIVKTQ